VAEDGTGGVFVRDSKDPDGPVLTFNAREWEAFLAGAKAGEFDPRAGCGSTGPGYSRAPWSRHVGRRWLSARPLVTTPSALHRSRRRMLPKASPRPSSRPR
jgi:hypothetical protein